MPRVTGGKTLLSVVELVTSFSIRNMITARKLKISPFRFPRTYFRVQCFIFNNKCREVPPIFCIPGASEALPLATLGNCHQPCKAPDPRVSRRWSVALLTNLRSDQRFFNPHNHGVDSTELDLNEKPLFSQRPGGQREGQLQK